MATATRARTTKTRTTKTRSTSPAPVQRHGCACLDLPRMHARGDSGCEHETAANVTIHRPTAAQIENQRIREAQAAAFLRDCGTDAKEMR